MDSKQKTARASDGKLGNLERLRKAGICLFVGGIVICVFGVLTVINSDQNYLTLDDGRGKILLAGFAVIILGAIVKAMAGKMAKKVAVSHTPEALKRVFDRLDEYDHKKGVDDSFIHSSDAGLPTYDRICEKKDYVRGVLRGIPVEFSEFELEKREEERDEDGEIQVTYTTVYSGIMLIARHGHELKQDIMLSQAVGSLFGGIKTESLEFNKLFNILSGDGHDVFYLLTPHYIERLIQLSKAKGKIFNITLRTDGKLLLALRNKNYFEAGGVTDVEGLIQKIVNEMNELGDILESMEVPPEGSSYPMGKRE